LTRAVPVTKLHGTQNDFVLIDERIARVADYQTFARLVCDRHAGVGADGLLVALPSVSADVRMRILNADGSEAEMCGNGIRCLARYLHDAGAVEGLRVETVSGIIATQVLLRHQRPYDVRVNLGVPRIETVAEVEDALFVWVGNPHVVIFPSKLDDVDLDIVGPELAAKIPGGANVHACVRVGPRQLSVRHFERGVGKTLACGTGAVAAAAAARVRGDVQCPVEVTVPGGSLLVEWDGSGDAFLTGPAVRVFDTQIDVPDAVLVAA